MHGSQTRKERTSARCGVGTDSRRRRRCMRHCETVSDISRLNRSTRPIGDRTRRATRRRAVCSEGPDVTYSGEQFGRDGGAVRTRIRPRRRGARRTARALVLVIALAVAASAPSGATTNRVFVFQSVSCVPQGDCFVAGTSTVYAGGAQPSTSLVARWNGTTWSTMSTVDRSDRNMNSLSDISCTAANFCMAVGGSTDTDNRLAEQPLVERWDGNTWKLLQSPVPLQQVSCTSRTFCMAVAGRLVARWDGSKWAIVPTVKVAAGQGFRVVSCVSPRACFAVGEYYDADGYTIQLAERWNGTQFSVSPRMATQRGYFSLSGLACASAVACVGAGAFTDGGLFSNVPFAAVWNGRRWSDRAPASPRAIASQLTGIACPSPTSCFASGGESSGPGPAGYPHPFLDHWNGVKWSVVSTPNIYGGLNDVACAGGRNCIAIGESQPLLGGTISPYLGQTSTLALRWNGTAWTRIATPNPS
jgi:hypothetical protein